MVVVWHRHAMPTILELVHRLPVLLGRPMQNLGRFPGDGVDGSEDPLDHFGKLNSNGQLEQETFETFSASVTSFTI